MVRVVQDALKAAAIMVRAVAAMASTALTSAKAVQDAAKVAAVTVRAAAAMASIVLASAKAAAHVLRVAEVALSQVLPEEDSLRVDILKADQDLDLRIVVQVLSRRLARALMRASAV